MTDKDDAEINASEAVPPAAQALETTGSGTPEVVPPKAQESETTSSGTLGVLLKAQVSETLETGLDVIARDSKRLVKFLRDLRRFGIEDLVPPLPKICVVGDQSVGKSSLIEGMSGIKVPRDHDTCTRCPIEINLLGSATSETPWECQVLLQRRYTYVGEDSKTQNRPLGPWLERQVENQHFKTVNHKDELCDALHWAQLAILNPGNSPERYRPGSNSGTEQTIQVKFSPNCVSLEITGPDLPNLAFYDLPGVINNSEVEDELYLVSLVKNLVKTYIKDDNCINLLALPMTADAANSSASSIIKEVEAQGRTLGVLTKPDRMQPGEPLNQWRAILRGKRFAVGYGYYVVKNNPDPTVDHATARAEEVAFFQNTQPYATELSEFKDRFGTVQLQKVLSKKLTDQIEASLPQIASSIIDKARAVDKCLSVLPAPPAGNLPLNIHTKIVEFSHNLKLHIDGGSPDAPFQKQWHSLVIRFQTQLEESQPELVLPSTIAAEPTPTIESDSDGLEVVSAREFQIAQETPTRKTPLKKRLANNLSPGHQSAQKRPKKAHDIPEAMKSKAFTLNDIRNAITVAYTDLPGQIPPQAIERMSRMSMDHWGGLLNRFLIDTRRLIENLVLSCVRANFSIWKKTPLFDEIHEFCKDFLSSAMEEQRVISSRCLAMELNKAMTFDEEALKQARGKALGVLQKARLKHRATVYINEQEALMGKPFAPQVREDKIARVNEDKLGTDPFDQEIQAMAHVMGYYERARSRFLDVIGQGCQNELFSKCRQNKLRDELIKKLGIEEPDAQKRCELLLAVDPKTEERRQRLLLSRESLNKARLALQELSAGNTRI
ncbi:hypothetical protein MMC11_000639 [Xylographa trunciseda]|nr:hypothetical protein [Xylographa trunciseda]